MRYHLDVAKQILEILPEEIKPKMDWILNDLIYKAPEEKLAWLRLTSVVNEIVGLKVDDNYQPINPEILLTDDWKIKAMSILSTASEETIREDIKIRTNK